MLKNFEPNKIFSITSRAPKYILFVFVIVISIGLIEALIISPEDYIQSHSVRIMYVHVPSAWISLGIFSTIAILSFIIIVFKNKSFILIAKSLAPSGLVFNIIALVTGSIWGKPTWGTWWAWDARITSMLILALFYIIYMVGLTIIIIHPAIVNDSIFQAFWTGIIFGVVAYGTYNLTNMATIKDWSSTVVLVDMLWGGFLTGFSSASGIYLSKVFFSN